MRLVDVVLYARDANQNALLLEIYVSELNVTSEADSSSDVLPILFRPYPVEFPRERIFLFLVVEQVSDGGSKHIPRRSCLCLIVADIGVWEHTVEHGVTVADSWF